MKKNRLLLVEDDLAYLALLSMWLKKAGFEVEAAEGGEVAKHRFLESPVPLVITDLAMPGMDGFSLLKLIKARCPDTVVILLTGKGSIEKAVQAMREGASDFLVKPVAEDKLVQLVQHYFKGLRSLKADSADPDLEAKLSPYALTKSERRIIEGVLKGETNHEIADATCVSYYTVKKHLQNVFKKMQLNNRIDLIIRFK